MQTEKKIQTEQSELRETYLKQYEKQRQDT